MTYEDYDNEVVKEVLLKEIANALKMFWVLSMSRSLSVQCVLPFHFIPPNCSCE